MHGVMPDNVVALSSFETVQPGQIAQWPVQVIVSRSALLHTRIFFVIPSAVEGSLSSDIGCGILAQAEELHVIPSPHEPSGFGPAGQRNGTMPFPTGGRRFALDET